MKLKILKKALLVLGLSVLTAGGAITAPLASNTTPVIAATINNTLTDNNFLGARPITPYTYETYLSSGKYVIKGETAKFISTPLLTTSVPKKVMKTRDGSYTVADGDIRYVNISGKKSWRYVVGGVVQTKFTGWVENTVTSSKPDFIKFTNGLIDVTATNKGSAEPLEIGINTLSNIGLLGTTCKLTPTLAPDVSGKITWSSSNTSVAKVSTNGTVSFLKKGDVTITAKLSTGAYSTLNMKVYDAEDEDIIFGNASFLYIGDTRQLAGKSIKHSFPVKFTSSGPNYMQYVPIKKWISSNIKVLTVSQNGSVNAVGIGSATITAQTQKGKLIKAIIEVKPVLAQKIEFEKGNKSTILYLNGKETLKTIVSPSTTTNKKVTYSSSNTKVATVSASGEVKAVGHGYAYITAKTSNGKTAQHTVYVIKKDGIYKEGNNYYYYKDDKKSTLTGVVYTILDNDYNSYGPWYIKNGKVDFTFTGFVKTGNDWLYFEKGNPCYYCNALKEGTVNGKKGLYFVGNASSFDTRKTGFAKYGNDWWYVEKGVVTKKYNGKVKGSIDGKTDTYNVVNSKVEQNIKNYTVTASNGTVVYYSKINNSLKPQLAVANEKNPYAKDSVLNIANRSGAKVAINASMWESKTINGKSYSGYPSGTIYANGIVYSSIANNSKHEETLFYGDGKPYANNQETLVLRNNGNLDSINVYGDNVKSLGIQWSCKGNIVITKEGKRTTYQNTNRNPYSFIAQDYDGTYYLGSCGGRNKQGAGLNYDELHNLFKNTISKNVKFIYVLDGGGSTAYVLNNNEVYNHDINFRKF